MNSRLQGALACHWLQFSDSKVQWHDWLRSSDVSKCPKEDTVRYFNLESYGKQFHWMQNTDFNAPWRWLEISDANAQMAAQ